MERCGSYVGVFVLGCWLFLFVVASGFPWWSFTGTITDKKQQTVTMEMHLTPGFPKTDGKNSQLWIQLLHDGKLGGEHSGDIHNFATGK